MGVYCCGPGPTDISPSPVAHRSCSLTSFCSSSGEAHNFTSVSLCILPMPVAKSEAS